MSDLMQQVQEFVTTEINPHLHSHGGGMKVLSCENGEVKVELKGACMGCPGTKATMRNIEAAIKTALPEVKSVVLAAV